MIDLGEMLDEFDDPAPRDDDALPTLADVDELPNRKHLRSLADLEAEGFNTTPPWPGFSPELHRAKMKSQREHLEKILTWSDPFLPGPVVDAPEAGEFLNATIAAATLIDPDLAIDFELWFPGDE